MPVKNASQQHKLRNALGVVNAHAKRSKQQKRADERAQMKTAQCTYRDPRTEVRCANDALPGFGRCAEHKD